MKLIMVRNKEYVIYFNANILKELSCTEQQDGFYLVLKFGERMEEGFSIGFDLKDFENFIQSDQNLFEINLFDIALT